MSTVPLDVLKEEVAISLSQKYPDLTVVNLTHNVYVDGINFKSGMIIVQMCVLRDGLGFIVKKLSSWYREHWANLWIVTPSVITKLALYGWLL